MCDNYSFDLQKFADYFREMAEIMEENYQQVINISMKNIKPSLVYISKYLDELKKSFTSEAYSEMLRIALENLQPTIQKLHNQSMQLQENEIVPENIAEETVTVMEKTSEFLEKHGIDTSLIPEFENVKKKKQFTIRDIMDYVTFFATIIGTIFTVIGTFQKNDITVININNEQNTTINVNLDESLENSKINQAFDHLQDLLEQILTLQENSEDSGKDSDSHFPDAKDEETNQDSATKETELE